MTRSRSVSESGSAFVEFAIISSAFAFIFVFLSPQNGLFESLVESQEAVALRMACAFPRLDRPTFAEPRPSLASRLGRCDPPRRRNPSELEAR